MKNLTLLLLLSLLVITAFGCDAAEPEPDPSEIITVHILGLDGSGTAVKIGISGSIIYSFDGENTTITLSDSTDQTFELGEVNTVQTDISKLGNSFTELKIELRDETGTILLSDGGDAPGTQVEFVYIAVKK